MAAQRGPRGSASSGETKTAPTISQALHLRVGDTVEPRFSCGKVLADFVKAKTPPAEAIEELFIRCLARPPTSEELVGFLQTIPEPPTHTHPYEDLVWALLNSTECMFNHR